VVGSSQLQSSSMSTPCPEGAQACSRGWSEAEPPEESGPHFSSPEGAAALRRSTELPSPFQGFWVLSDHPVPGLVQFAQLPLKPCLSVRSTRPRTSRREISVCTVSTVTYPAEGAAGDPACHQAVIRPRHRHRWVDTIPVRRDAPDPLRYPLIHHNVGASPPFEATDGSFPGR
jgi:hypothetical protein